MFPNRKVIGIVYSHWEWGRFIYSDDNGCPLLNTYYMPGTMPRIWHILFNSFYNNCMAGAVIMTGTSIYDFADEETEAQKLSYITRSHS